LHSRRRRRWPRRRCRIRRDGDAEVFPDVVRHVAAVPLDGAVGVVWARARQLRDELGEAPGALAAVEVPGALCQPVHHV